MKVTGKIVEIGDVINYTKSDGTPKRKQFIRIEEEKEFTSHNDSIAIALTDDRIDKNAGLQIGDHVTCIYDIDSKISGEKAYNDARVFSLEIQ